jgi:hypothetical protein
MLLTEEDLRRLRSPGAFCWLRLALHLPFESLCAGLLAELASESRDRRRDLRVLGHALGSDGLVQLCHS